MTTIGYLANEIIAQGGNGHVMGKTSHGIYLSTPTRWLIYCSWERFCSPLTIITEGKVADLELVTAGMKACFDDQQLRIPGAGINLNLDLGNLWVPKNPIEQPLAAEDILERIGILRHKVMNLKGDGVDFAGANLPRILDDELLEETLKSQIGVGEGLTPYGDDFVIGCLLACNHYQVTHGEEYNLKYLNQQIVTSAYQQTTRLSANLIELASWGESDERLMNALDYAMGSQDNLDDVAVDLSSWGHSSGMAGLEGIAYRIELTI
jgi:hypothetical protein